MVEPVTANRGLIVPNTGDLVSQWGTAAMNPNFAAIDGMFGGVAAFSLSGATTILLTGSIAASPGSAPSQQQNAVIRLTGSQSGNAVFQFTLPGFYIIDHQTTVNSFFVQCTASSGGGTIIGVPPGRKSQVFFDGTNFDFVDRADVGTAYDLHGVTALPAWMTACTVTPYLIKDGTIYSTSAYPQLASLLGSTFGGNGASTFGVPDERARARVGYDPGGTGRLTTAVSGVNGGTMGSAGGSQSLQSHNHTDAGHFHSFTYNAISNSYNAQVGSLHVITQLTGSDPFNDNTELGAAAIQSTGAGAAQNVQPSIVSFLPLIKT